MSVTLIIGMMLMPVVLYMGFMSMFKNNHRKGNMDETV